MKIYKHADKLPLRNWDKIHDGDNLNLLYLFKKSKDRKKNLSDKDSNYLYKIYCDILSELNNLDFSLQKAFLKFKIENLILISDFYLSEINKLNQIEPIKIKFDNAETALTNYLKKLNENFETFKIGVYKTKSDLDNLYRLKYKSDPPEFFKKLQNKSFHIHQQYYEFIEKEFKEHERLILKSDKFIKESFDYSEIEIIDILELNNLFKKIFAENFKKWVEIRNDIFDYTKLKGTMKKKSQKTYIDNVINIAQILELPLNPHKMTVSEFESYSNLASQKIKAMENANFKK